MYFLVLKIFLNNLLTQGCHSGDDPGFIVSKCHTLQDTKCGISLNEVWHLRQ